MEQWCSIEGYPNYEISNYGRVHNVRTGRILKTGSNERGYPRVALCNDGELPKQFPVHRLVAFAFVDGYFDGAHVNHIDGIKHNNAASNLEWVTHAENMAHSSRLGLGLGKQGKRKIIMIITPEDREQDD